ncbi:MAG: hypothetical protein JNL45_11050 [Hyphomicrobium sp.]|nr:hypothetical protein [Hyphomicrobium sp.]
METNISSSEQRDVQERVERVTSLVKDSAVAWIQIGVEFADAKDGLSVLAFDRFLNDSGFTRAVGDKLVCIGKCTALRSERAKQFVGFIDGWTTLYEVTKLGPVQVDRLWDALEQDANLRLSRAVVQNIARGSPLQDRIIVLGLVEVSESKLKGMTSSQIALVKSRLDEIHRLIDNAPAGIKFAERKQNIKLLANVQAANQTMQIVNTAA